MGQYHKCVNLDKREYVSPHKLGTGLKLWEQLVNNPGTGAALIILLASASNGDGGGDISQAKIVGSWRGDRIAFVGDYDDASEYWVGTYDDCDLLKGSAIYSACGDKKIKDKAKRWKDVSLDVARVIEGEFAGKYSGDGWRSFTYNNAKEAKSPGMKPDMLIVSR